MSNSASVGAEGSSYFAAIDARLRRHTRKFVRDQNLQSLHGPVRILVRRGKLLAEPLIEYIGKKRA